MRAIGKDGEQLLDFRIGSFGFVAGQGAKVVTCKTSESTSTRCSEIARSPSRNRSSSSLARVVSLLIRFVNIWRISSREPKFLRRSTCGSGDKSEISRGGRVDLAQFFDRRSASKAGIGGSFN